MIKKMLAAAGLTIALVSPASAWDLKDVNAAAEAMNFDVAGGCSGTLISNGEKSLIITAYHCIDGYVDQTTKVKKDDDGFIVETPTGDAIKSKKVELQPVPISQHFFDEEGKKTSLYYSTEIVARNKDMDLAVLEIDREIGGVALALKAGDGAIKLADKDTKLERGEELWAIGNPFGLHSVVTKGVYSGPQSLKDFGLDEKSTPSFFAQFDGGLAPGNSGGGLFNTNGELVGVNVMAVPGFSHIGLSSPLESIWELLEDKCLAADVGGTNPPKCGLKGTASNGTETGTK